MINNSLQGLSWHEWKLVAQNLPSSRQAPFVSCFDSMSTRISTRGGGFENSSVHILWYAEANISFPRIVLRCVRLIEAEGAEQSLHRRRRLTDWTLWSETDNAA